MPRRESWSRLVLLAVLVLCAGCTGPAEADERGPLTLWSHGGTAAERTVVSSLVHDWERTSGVPVDLTFLDEGGYNDRVQAAAAAGTLPDVLDVDGPWTANLAYRGDLLPLEDRLDPATLADLLPSLAQQGGYGGRTYSVGAFDSGLALFADRRALVAAGVRVPAGPGDAWTAAETTAALAALAARDEDGRVLDLKLSYGSGEWFTYAFAPLLVSAGAELVDPVTRRARGHLDSPEAVAALTALASWAPYVDPDPDGTAFTERRVPLSWVGHWQHAAYQAALGDDLVLVPLPDLGRGSRSGLGSWAWGVSSGTSRDDQAVDLVEHLVSPDAVRQMTRANSAVPGRVSVLESTPAYAPGGPLHLYAEQLRRACPSDERALRRDACVAVARPVTPAYPVVTSTFAMAVRAVLVEDVPPDLALGSAARTIDQDVDLNHGYRTP